jgi:hypothetical protein
LNRCIAHLQAYDAKIKTFNNCVEELSGRLYKSTSNMAPAPIDPAIVDVATPKKDSLPIPAPARERLLKAGIDLSNGYPYRPSRPLYLQDVYKIRGTDRKHIDAGTRADKSKKNLLSAATKVTDITANIGTEIEGIQLKDLSPEQRDELALLIAERSVVFFRNQDISPQQQKELGEWYGDIEVHVSHLFGIHKATMLICAPASSTTSPRSRRSYCNLARSPGHRAASEFSQPWRIVCLAHGSCT